MGQRKRNAFFYLPAPVTRATLPCSDADGSPTGPGIWSYLLVPEGMDVTPGIVALVDVVVGMVEDLDCDVRDKGGEGADCCFWCWWCCGCGLGFSVSLLQRVGEKKTAPSYTRQSGGRAVYHLCLLP